MKVKLILGLMTLTVMVSWGQTALARPYDGQCAYELTNRTSRRIYFSLNRQSTSLAPGESLFLDYCGALPFPRTSFVPKQPSFASPTVKYDGLIGAGYKIKRLTLKPGLNFFTQYGRSIFLKPAQSNDWDFMLRSLSIP